jgi:hypothetical protein
MKTIMLLLQHKLLISIVTVLILVGILWGAYSSRQETLNPAQEADTTAQPNKMDKFKSGHYQLSKGKTW